MTTQLEKLRNEQAERLEIIRKSANLNQEQFAAYLDIKPGSYADIKRGKNGISTRILNLLEKKLAINVNWLLYNLGEMKVDQSVPASPMAEEMLIPYKTMPREEVSSYIEKLFEIIKQKDDQINKHIETIGRLTEIISRVDVRK